MTNPANRLITLILLLQRQPNQKAGDLAKKLDVSVRTLHRYMEMLDEMGIPIYAERGPYGGFSLVRGYKLPPLVFSPEEAVAVSLGTSLVGEMWGQLYQQPAQGALAKIENVLPDEQRGEVAWARRSLIATGMHRSDIDVLAPFLEKLRRAAREYLRVKMNYRGGNQTEAEWREFDPYALVHRWGWWYVIGHCQLRKDMRSFRVDRIEELNLTDQNFSIPADFDVHTYMANELKSQPQILAKLSFSAEGAQIANYNRIYWDDMQEQPDGSILVTMGVPDLNWAAATVLAYGPLVTVLEPASLRQLVAEWAQAIVKQYKE
jgi:predicted DNA-binding transcriptional regulator YafY